MAGALRFESAIVLHGVPLERAFGYASDFARAHEWRAEVISSAMEPPGRMAVGSHLVQVAILAGTEVKTYAVVDECDAPNFWSFRSVSGPIPMQGSIRCEQTPSGTRLTYVLIVEPPAEWEEAQSKLRRSGHHTVAESLATLADNLHFGG